MPTYKCKFNNYQLERLNCIDNEKIRASLMSILAYLRLYNERMNEKYKQLQLDIIRKESEQLRISFSKLHKEYIRFHEKISLATLKNRINDLIDLKLLKVHQENKTNVYSFISELTNNLADNLTNQESYQTIENTNFTEDEYVSKYVNSESNIDLDSNNCTNNMNYNEYISDEEKVQDVTLVIKKANELFKALKVKSKWIKDKVLSKLIKYSNNITIKHLESYICTCINNARKQYYSKYEEIRRESYNEPKKLRFNNFEAREYDYDSLEKKLLGWE